MVSWSSCPSTRRTHFPSRRSTAGIINIKLPLSRNFLISSGPGCCFFPGETEFRKPYPCLLWTRNVSRNQSEPGLALCLMDLPRKNEQNKKKRDQGSLPAGGLAG